jgi:hypothetical protein
MSFKKKPIEDDAPALADDPDDPLVDSAASDSGRGRTLGRRPFLRVAAATPAVAAGLSYSSGRSKALVPLIPIGAAAAGALIGGGATYAAGRFLGFDPLPDGADKYEIDTRIHDEAEEAWLAESNTFPTLQNDVSNAYQMAFDEGIAVFAEKASSASTGDALQTSWKDEAKAAASDVIADIEEIIVNRWLQITNRFITWIKWRDSVGASMLYVKTGVVSGGGGGLGSPARFDDTLDTSQAGSQQLQLQSSNAPYTYTLVNGNTIEVPEIAYAYEDPVEYMVPFGTQGGIDDGSTDVYIRDSLAINSLDPANYSGIDSIPSDYQKLVRYPFNQPYVDLLSELRTIESDVHTDIDSWADANWEALIGEEYNYEDLTTPLGVQQAAQEADDVYGTTALFDQSGITRLRQAATIEITNPDTKETSQIDVILGMAAPSDNELTALKNQVQGRETVDPSEYDAPIYASGLFPYEETADDGSTSVVEKADAIELIEPFEVVGSDLDENGDVTAYTRTTNDSTTSASDIVASYEELANTLEENQQRQYSAGGGGGGFVNSLGFGGLPGGAVLALIVGAGAWLLGQDDN